MNNNVLMCHQETTRSLTCVLKSEMLWQVWTFWRPDGHCEEVPLRHTLLQPSRSDALSTQAWAIHHSSHPTAGRQVSYLPFTTLYYATAGRQVSYSPPFKPASDVHEVQRSKTETLGPMTEKRLRCLPISPAPVTFKCHYFQIPLTDTFEPHWQSVKLISDRIH